MSNQGATVTEPEDPQAVEADTAPVDTTTDPAPAPAVGADGVFVSPPADEPTQL